MLTHLSIKNYALIDDLSVAFTSGLTTITGETGAGKSILLDGLSLVLGKRADLSALRDNDKKCVIEAEFNIGPYRLHEFFKSNELEFQETTIIRREIHPSGKSRAFVNDTPLTLDILTLLGRQLIDVHSQHQTLALTGEDFQMKVVDALAGNKNLLADYQSGLSRYKQISRELEQFRELKLQAEKEQDYNNFLLQELLQANLKPGMLEELEEQHEQLGNVELIMENLGGATEILTNEEAGVLPLLQNIKSLTGKLSGYGQAYATLQQRLQSVQIELDDLAMELNALLEATEADPELLARVGEQLQKIYSLQKKHGVEGIDELLQVQRELEQKVVATEELDDKIESHGKILQNLENDLRELAAQIHNKREAVLPELKQQMEGSLHNLGMPNATFRLDLEKKQEFLPNGRDQLHFLFAANKGTSFGELKKVASGGELSRIMLAIKAILARYEQLPTMMFDEIDTGVSGEVSNAMGAIMQQMSKSMQIFTITHLPQVASKGDQQFKVYKEDTAGFTRTRIKELSGDERVVELAEMLGGKSLTDSALAHARQLLN